jgi:hypothetical protein
VWDVTDLKIILEELSPHICITVGLILLTWFLHLSSRRSIWILQPSREYSVKSVYAFMNNGGLVPYPHSYNLEALCPSLPESMASWVFWRTIKSWLR